MSEVLKNPTTVSWGAVAGAVAAITAQIMGIGNTQLVEQLKDQGLRIEQHRQEISERIAEVDRRGNARMAEMDRRVLVVERTSDRVVDRMDGLRIAVDAMSASSTDLSKQVRELAQIVAVMDNRVLTMSRDIDQARRPADGR